MSEETPVGGPLPMSAAKGKGKQPLRQPQGGSYTDDMEGEGSAVEARMDKLESMLTSFIQSQQVNKSNIEQQKLDDIKSGKPSTSGDATASDQAAAATAASEGGAAATAETSSASTSHTITTSGTAPNTQYVPYPYGQYGPQQYMFHVPTAQTQAPGQTIDGAAQGAQQPPQQQQFMPMQQGAAILPVFAQEKKKRKRDKTCTKGYSDTDSGDEDQKWEVEAEHETADRHEAMRVASMAPTPNVKAKAIREHQKSMLKPIKSLEEMMKLLKMAEFNGKREVIRRAREAHKAAQDRWDELLIAESHGFTVVEKYRQQKATGKEKALATALDKATTKRTFNSGSSHKRGSAGSASSSGAQNDNRVSRRSPSPRGGQRARSPFRSSNSSSGGFGQSSYRSGPRKPFTCNFCNRPGHYWRECPDSTRFGERRKRSNSPKEEWGRAIADAKAGEQTARSGADERRPRREQDYSTEYDAMSRLKRAVQEAGFVLREKANKVCGNIHREEYRNFWKEIAKNDQYVLEIIEHGYKMQFDTEPEQYQEKNNKSAMENKEFVSEKIAEMCEEGVVSEVGNGGERPRCISPITVASRVNPDGTIKKRFCWDGSRMVNPCLKSAPVKFADLKKSVELVEEGDFMFVYDLKSCYYHVKMHEESKKYLAFEWEGKIYQYNALPFGLATAAAVVTRLTKPICGFINEAGYRHSIYIDDGRGGAESARKAEEARKFVISTMQRAGFVISEEKSDKEHEAAQKKKYLGLIINSKSMSIHTPEEKITEVQKLIEESLGRRQTAKEKARVIGKIVALELSMGKVTQILTKSAQADVAKVSESHGWSWRMTWSEQAEDELRLFRDECRELDGCEIPSRHKDKKLSDLFDEADRVAASDASATGTCAYSLKGEKFFILSQLTQEERQMSSGVRELIALQRAIEILKRRGYEGSKQQNLLWMTDSANLVAFMEKGSMKAHIQERVFKLYKMCRKMKINITVKHVSREDPRIQLADAGSRIADKDSWSVDGDTLEWLEGQLGQTDIDVFADYFNRKKRRFVSQVEFGDPEFVDAFSKSWERIGTVYACPPVDAIIHTIRKIEREREAKGILLIPAWKTGYFWPYVWSQGRLNKRFREAIPVCPKLEAREWARPYMHGKSMQFVALSF